MKIIHCADLHLGSRLTSLPSGDIRNSKKNEVLNSFTQMLNYAKENEIKIIMLSGDVFDSNRPSKKDKNYFYDAIRANSDITFLYLRGNHDTEESLNENLDNLITFTTDWKTYDFDNITISGIELSETNKTSLYSTINLDKDKINIVMMHGDVSSKGKDFIDYKKLSNKNIDYLALGHIHSYMENRIDSRGVYVYPGCLVGRGFDELGEKGFVVLDINEKIEYSFIPVNQHQFVEKEIDISSANNLYTAKDLIDNEIKDIDKSALLKIILVGNVDFDITDIDLSIETFFKQNFFFLKVYSKLKEKININDYLNDFSLKGEFIRRVYNNSSYSDDEKNEILSIGMKLLNGEDIE